MEPHTPSVFDVAAILITLAAGLSWFNHKVLKLPSTVGLALMGVVASLIVLLIDAVTPMLNIGGAVRQFLSGVDFEETLMHGMLSFLLFAGALHVDLNALMKHKWPVIVLSTVGVLISTGLIGGGLYLIAGIAGIDISFAWCLVFGALISPTDPVAVMGAMKSAKTDQGLQATISGESLFNDGVGVVVFSILVGAAAAGEFSLAEAGNLFIVEAIGGGALGLALGWIAFVAMRAIDDYPVELLITLAVVMGGYSLAQSLHVSGPIAVAAAGLLLGNRGVALAMSETTRDHLIKFWGLVDEVFNAVLFLLIGLEGVVLIHEPGLLLVGAATIPLVLLARAIAVGGPLLSWPRTLPFRATFPALLWGGLRGGISIALALSLPPSPAQELIVTTTYVVVLFSVLVQGTTISRVLKRAPSPEATQGAH